MIEALGAPAAPAPVEARTTSTDTLHGASFDEALTAKVAEAERPETPPADTAEPPTEAQQAQAAMLLMLALANVAPAAQPSVAASTETTPETHPVGAVPAQTVSMAPAETVPLAQAQPVEAAEAAIPVEGEPQTEAELPADFAKLLEAMPKAEVKETVKPITPQRAQTEAAPLTASTETPPNAPPVALPQKHSPPEAAKATAAERGQESPPPAFGTVTAPHLQHTEPARLAEAQLKTTAPMNVEINADALRTQIAGPVETLWRTGESAMRLQLNPESLGRIELQVTSNAAGTQVRIITDLPVTGSLIERHIHELRDSLTQSGLNVSELSVNVGHSGTDAHRGQAFAWQGRRWETVAAAPKLNEPVLAELNLPPTRLIGGSHIDYRI
jgi:flagellar hook-length control protein FliK